MTPREARFLLDFIGQDPRAIDLHAVAARLGCQPDLVSIREALEGVVGRG
jgi:hypothetical protein